MTFVQTSPFLGQVFKENGEVDVVNDMSGDYSLYIDSYQIGTAVMERRHVMCSTRVRLFVKNIAFSFDEMECKGDNLGCKCWLGSIASVIYFTHQNTLNTQNTSCNILELGAGVGICGIVLAKFNGLANIVISDGFVNLSQVIEKNITINILKNASYAHLKWGDHHHEQGRFDYVIGCECVYRPEVADLIDTTMYFLKTNGKAIFINTPAPYRHGVFEFIQGLKKHGAVNVQHLYLQYNQTHKAPFILIEFTKMS